MSLHLRAWRVGRTGPRSAAAPGLVRVAVVLALVACAASATSEVFFPSGDLAGNWSGSDSSRAYGNGALNFALSTENLILTPPGVGSQVAIQGTWSTSFANPAMSDSGTVDGTGWSASDSVTIQLNGSNHCTWLLRGTRDHTPAMRGVYGTTGCSVSDTGSFTMKRQ